MSPASSTTSSVASQTTEKPSAPAPSGVKSTSSFADTLSRSGPPVTPPPSGAAADASTSSLLAPLPADAADGEAAPDGLPTQGSDTPLLDEAPPTDANAPWSLRGRAAGDTSATPRTRARPDPLDPAARHAAQMGPLFQPSEAAAMPSLAPSAPAEAQARASMESMLPELVRKIAWAGDGKKGSMRLELGAGALAGGTLVVHADDGRVRVELNAPAGTDVAAWKARLHERLERRGVAVDEVIVD